MPPPLSTGMTMKRIHREIKDIQNEDLGGMSLGPTDESPFVWHGIIPGPEGSQYEGGEFKLTLELASDYPFSAPKVIFNTRIYHMNISDRGNVCLDILKQNWSPALSLYKVLLSLSSLLTDPNPKDPLVPSIANEYMRNRKKHDNTAREWTKLYAQPDPTAAAKGKAKAPAEPVQARATPAAAPTAPANRPRRNTRSIQPTEEVIDLTDSSRDSSTRNSKRAKRKRTEEEAQDSEASSARRRRSDVDTGTVIVLD